MSSVTYGGKRSTTKSASTCRFTGSDSTFQNLLDDVLFLIFSYCDVETLCRLSRVCKKFNNLIKSDCVWVWLSRNSTLVQDTPDINSYRPAHWSCQYHLSVKERCRISTNWRRGTYQDRRQVYHSTRQMPWMVKSGGRLWISFKNIIRCYRQSSNNGRLNELPKKVLSGHRDDLCRFVKKDDCIISGSRDGRIICWDVDTCQTSFTIDNAHSSDVDSVDIHGNTVISGSRDTTIKVWRTDSDEETGKIRSSLQYKIDIQDRTWSLAMGPEGRNFVSGTAGLNHVDPLQVWDLERGKVIMVLGENTRNGAGVRDIQFLSPHTLLSCGYDTSIQLWDLRVACNQSVSRWLDPWDSTVNCIRSDGKHSVLAGTVRHGLVRLWDMRKREPIEGYFVGKGNNSPVYSLAFDSCYLYVALDKGINMLDFTVRRSYSSHYSPSHRQILP